jgi:hypothetical protein
MARIQIEDLPVGDNLTPEQEELILGAGRLSFRPNLEGLEARELMDAGLAHRMLLAAAPSGGMSPPAHVRLLDGHATGSTADTHAALPRGPPWTTSSPRWAARACPRARSRRRPCRATAGTSRTSRRRS